MVIWSRRMAYDFGGEGLDSAGRNRGRERCAIENVGGSGMDDA